MTTEISKQNHLWFALFFFIQNILKIVRRPQKNTMKISSDLMIRES